MKYKQFMVTILIGVISTPFLGCGLLRKDLHDSSTVNPTPSLKIVTLDEIEQGKDFKMGFRYFPKEGEEALISRITSIIDPFKTLTNFP